MSPARTDQAIADPASPGAPTSGRWLGGWRSPLVLCFVIAILAVSNIVSNRAWPQAYVPWNVAVTLLLLVVARRAGLSWTDLGLGRRGSRRGLLVGGLAVALVAAVYLVALALPVTRAAFLDQRAAGPLSAALLAALVRIPFGTVLLEEVAFRGVLPALVSGSWWRGALVSSVLFGLWHVLPSIGVDSSNAALAAAFGNWGTVAQAALAVVAMTGAGLVLMAWRRWGGHLLTPVLSHLATNSLGVLIAWWLVSGR